MTQKPPGQGGSALTMLPREESVSAGGGHVKAAGSIAVGN
jgi:hypothetical protein